MLIKEANQQRSVFKLPTQTQAAFWFMLFNRIECNNYSIINRARKKKNISAIL